MFQTTSSTVNGSPSCHTALAVMLYSQTDPYGSPEDTSSGSLSGTTHQLVARFPTVSRSFPTENRESYTRL